MVAPLPVRCEELLAHFNSNARIVCRNYGVSNRHGFLESGHEEDKSQLQKVSPRTLTTHKKTRSICVCVITCPVIFWIILGR